MTPLTQEWIEKAEGDFTSAGRELRARKDPNYDSACFHAQQCAEKYLKARLTEENLPFKRSHDLVMLLNLLIPIEPSWQALMPQLTILTVFAVDFRYPGMRGLKRNLTKHCHMIANEGLQVDRIFVSNT